MVFLSGMLAVGSVRRASGSYLKYVRKRFSRLVIPTWIFLAFYFAGNIILCGKSFQLGVIVKSFLLLQTGIGYVWVILVYLICAMEVPFLNKLNFSRKSYVFYLIAIYIGYELMQCFEITRNSKFLFYTLYYAIPYGLALLFGMKWKDFEVRVKYFLGGASGIIYLCIATWYYISLGEYQLTSIAKYPPTAYYLSYAFATIVLLVSLFEKNKNRLPDSKFVEFIGKSTLWIYLWHIVFIDIYNSLDIYWSIKYLLIMLSTCVVVYMQNKLCDMAEKRGINRKIIDILRG